MYLVEALHSAWVRFYMPCHNLAVFCVCVCTIGEKVLQHSAFDLFPVTYMCVDIDFRLFKD